jgi:hypothetical protein
MDGDRLMGYTLPIICLEDSVLERETVMEFLGDVCFGRLPLKEYLERKENVIKMYQNWSAIFA